MNKYFSTNESWFVNKISFIKKCFNVSCLSSLESCLCCKGDI